MSFVIPIEYSGFDICLVGGRFCLSNHVNSCVLCVFVILLAFIAVCSNLCVLLHEWYQRLCYHTSGIKASTITQHMKLLQVFSRRRQLSVYVYVCVCERERERERWTRREEGSQKKSKGFKFKARDSNLCLTQCQISNLTDIGIWRQVKEEDCNVRKRRRMIFFPNVFFFFFFLG